MSLGGRLFDVVEGVEQWQLNDVEVGLSSFLFHRDYRDYFSRHGGRVSAALRATDDADLTLLAAPDWRHLAYHVGGEVVCAVVRSGRLEWRR